MNLAIFGGSFNPIHYGHIKGALEVQKKFQMEKFIILPNFRNPLKESDLNGASAFHRLSMARLAFKDLEGFEVSDYEVQKEEVSYTIDSVNFFFKKYEVKNLYFILGLDNLSQLHMWKNYEELLQKVNLILIHRPGYKSNILKESPLSNFVENFSENEILFKSGKKLFPLLSKIDISSTDLRQGLFHNKNLPEYTSLEVMEYIKKHNLYEN